MKSRVLFIVRHGSKDVAAQIEKGHAFHVSSVYAYADETPEFLLERAITRVRHAVDNSVWRVVYLPHL